MAKFTVLLCCLIVQVNAFISIQIDEENFPQIADFLQTFAHGPIIPYEHSFFLRNFKKFSGVFAQMVGIMLTLTASSILSAHLAPTPIITIPQSQDPKVDICVGNFTNFNERFKNNFGCHNNGCWRSCYSDAETEFWCYTSPQADSREYKICTSHTDCAPYWECLHPCQKGKYELFLNYLTTDISFK